MLYISYSTRPYFPIKFETNSSYHINHHENLKYIIINLHVQTLSNDAFSSIKKHSHCLVIS